MAKVTTKEKTKQSQKLSKVLADLKIEYLEALPHKIEKIKSLTQQEKWPEVYEEYHKLKGTGKTYGFPEISILCEQMEKLAQKKESQKIPLFLEAALLLGELHSAFQKNKSYDLLSHPLGKTLLKSGRHK